jgi:hypothetical protein
VSDQYAASSGGEGGKFLGARVYWLSSLSPSNSRTMMYDTKRTLKVQYQNNEEQDTNKNEALKKSR